MKLVTPSSPPRSPYRRHFNPHEREARDVIVICQRPHLPLNFNPHEREARDQRRRRKQQIRGNFNPHEREARDRFAGNSRTAGKNFNPHEREARDGIREG